VLRPNKTIEKSAGIVGSLAIFGWAFHGALLVIDSIGRVQTTVAMAPYLGSLMSPLAFVLEFVGGFFLLWFALKLEYSRERDEVPLVILAYTSPKTLKPKRLWLKGSGRHSSVSVRLCCWVLCLLDEISGACRR
jgi:hypothetical protein